MVSINPSDPDYRNATGTASPVPSRELPLEPEPAPLIGGRSPYWPLGGVPWGGIIAGSLTTIALLMLSSAFAAACGVPAYRGGAYGWGAGFWGVITCIIAFFIGAAVAGMVPPRERLGGAIRGLITWSLTIPLTLMLSTSAFGFLHGPVANLTPVPGADGLVTGGLNVTGPAWGAFLGMILGLFAALIGGVFGAVSTRNMTVAKP